MGSFLSVNGYLVVTRSCLCFLMLTQAFFAEHPNLAKKDFYITGESYAGHYIPAFAARVHKGNKANEGVHVNLKACDCFLSLSRKVSLKGWCSQV